MTCSIDCRVVSLPAMKFIYSLDYVLNLENGSEQFDLWGGNIFPSKPSDKRIEFTSLINIRPKDDNCSMEIENDDIREKVTTLVETLLMSPDDNLA